MNQTVSLEAAKALEAVGYPQDEWSQAVARSVKAVWHTGEEPDLHCAPEPWAAPDPLSALDWLEREKGWKWAREWLTDRHRWYGLLGIRYRGEGAQEGHNYLKADTADALILAICKLADARQSETQAR